MILDHVLPNITVVAISDVVNHRVQESHVLNRRYRVVFPVRIIPSIEYPINIVSFDPFHMIEEKSPHETVMLILEFD